MFAYGKLAKIQNHNKTEKNKIVKNVQNEKIENVAGSVVVNTSYCPRPLAPAKQNST
jgi:hypothetical protein